MQGTACLGPVGGSSESGRASSKERGPLVTSGIGAPLHSLKQLLPPTPGTDSGGVGECSGKQTRCP